MLDLANRNNQVKAAIGAYEQHLATWATSGSTPAADETTRKDFQDNKIAPLMSAVKDHRANVASATTDKWCDTTYTAPTSCLLELMEQHEHVHKAACHAHPGPRHADLADYAREEIEGYRSERSYIEAALDKLERECRYTLEFDSMISGATETTRSEAKTRVDLEVHFPRGYVSKGLNGSKPLGYNTRDVGPPKVIGDRMLSKLYINCYAASQGSGNVSFEVRHAWMMRELTPPHGPLLELPIYVGDTRETRRLKGPRGCPRSSEQVSFWTEQFKLGKRIEPALPADIRDSAPIPSDLAVIVDGWTFTGQDAEKTIETPCAGMNVLAGTPGFEALPTGPIICEKTVLKLKKK